MTLNLMIGNIGTGKSTIARKLAFQGSAVFNMDSFQEMLSGGEYARYDPKKRDVYTTGENETIRAALKSGLDVCVDRTNMDLKRRERFIQIGKEYGAKIVAYHLGVGDRAKCLANRAKNPRGVPMTVWGQVYDKMVADYVPPTLDEGFSEIIEVPKRFKFYAFDFDGTLVENKFPELGAIISREVDRLNQLYEDLSNIIIIWTCRSGEYESLMRNFLINNHIPFDFINENPMVDYGSRKIFATEYIDDRNGVAAK